MDVAVTVSAELYNYCGIGYLEADVFVDETKSAPLRGCAACVPLSGWQRHGIR
jgi:hypothetical protein